MMRKNIFFLHIILFLLAILLLTSCIDQLNIAEPSKESLPIPSLTPTKQMIPTSRLPTATLDPDFQITRDAKATYSAYRAYVSEEEIYGKDQAQIIIDTIETYFQDKGQYPESLQLLVPDYISDIPITMTEQKFEYTLSNHWIYILSFNLDRTNGYFMCGYLRSIESWECSGSGIQ